MDKIELKAYAKINLGLDVIRKREDGYHDVKMIMQTVDIYDELIFRKIDQDKIILTTNDLSIPTDGKNLVCKAIELLRNEFNINGGVSVHLNKKIPVEAGMAGGSTDCAAALKAVNILFELGLSDDELMIRGKKLGADVPYCIIGGTALSEGIGEKLTKLNKPPECILVVAKPNIGVSTKFVYENLKINELASHPDIDGMIDNIDSGDLFAMANKMENVLESVTIPTYPVINDIKNIMKNEGAINALMSGSGPTVFGIFDDSKTAKKVTDILLSKEYIKTCCISSFINN